MSKNLLLPDFLLELFDALNSKKIIYVVLRNYESLPYDVGNDLDILISKHSYKDVYKVAKEIADSKNLEINKKHIRNTYNGIYFKSNNCSDFNLKIDFYTSLVKGWLKYSDSEIILRNRKKREFFYVPSPTHELQAIVYKEAFAYNSVRDKYSKQIKSLSVNLCEKEFFDVCKKLISHRNNVDIYNKLIKKENLESLKLKPKFKNLFNIKAMIFWLYYHLKDI